MTARPDTRILVIDDDELMLEMVGDRIQQELGCEVHRAADREEAEALLDCYSYSLVVTDLSLSPERFEGLDLIDEIGEVNGQTRIVALSGCSTERIEWDARLKGADQFVRKPKAPSELAAIVRDLLDSRLASPKPPISGKLLRHLLTEGTIETHLQPIFRLRPEGPIMEGVECLARGPANSPFRRPDAMFAYARHKRAEHILDRHAISVALTAASGVPKQLQVSLNIHASTLGRCTDFAQWLCNTSSAQGITPDRLVVEIIEHAPGWNKKEFLQTLANLRQMGVKIAMDDIGLGHSNYQMMVDAQPDYFKIDRYFVNGCSHDKHRWAVVASIATLAAKFGGSVIAEGVEDVSDLETLRELGIDLVQAFLFCPPVTVSQLRESDLKGWICPCSIQEGSAVEEDCRMRALGICLRSQHPETGCSAGGHPCD
jgi:EAL domain-containing protein (putative c-di-GMP-specific phosphodiesterase class I)/FixJ family two-component response regulator